MKGWSHLIHGWLHLGLKSRSASLKVNLLEINILSDLGGNFTLKVAKASEAISNVDSSTYLKKSLNWLEKRTILASGSCRIHSLSIIPQRRAICGASYLKHKQERKQNSYSTNEIHQRYHKQPVQFCWSQKYRHHLSQFIRTPFIQPTDCYVLGAMPDAGDTRAHREVTVIAAPAF